MTDGIVPVCGVHGPLSSKAMDEGKALNIVAIHHLANRRGDPCRANVVLKPWVEVKGQIEAILQKLSSRGE